jgi:hypothetical protein
MLRHYNGMRLSGEAEEGVRAGLAASRTLRLLFWLHGDVAFAFAVLQVAGAAVIWANAGMHADWMGAATCFGVVGDVFLHDGWSITRWRWVADGQDMATLQKTRQKGSRVGLWRCEDEDWRSMLRRYNRRWCKAAPTGQNANTEIHPAKPAGWGGDGVPRLEREAEEGFATAGGPCVFTKADAATLRSRGIRGGCGGLVRRRGLRRFGGRGPGRCRSRLVWW